MKALETISGLAVRYLNQERIDALRNIYFVGRSKLYPLMRLAYGTFNAADLRAHLEEKVGRDFDILMVHSSINHMAPMYTEGPLEMVRMLMDYCGQTKTLAMPAFWFGDPKIGGAYATLKQNPRFDLRRTPSQMGLATELFRRMPGVVQSRNAVYRVSALGPLAREMAMGHENCIHPAGLGSPFDFMARHNTMIIGIGKPFQVMTQAHSVEGILGDDFPVPLKKGSPLPITIIDGKDEIPSALNGSGISWRFNIWKLRNIMNKQTLREWSFHHVPLFSARAGDVTSALIEAAKQGITLYDKPD